MIKAGAARNKQYAGRLIVGTHTRRLIIDPGVYDEPREALEPKQKGGQGCMKCLLALAHNGRHKHVAHSLLWSITRHRGYHSRSKEAWNNMYTIAEVRRPAAVGRSQWSRPPHCYDICNSKEVPPFHEHYDSYSTSFYSALLGQTKAPYLTTTPCLGTPSSAYQNIVVYVLTFDFLIPAQDVSPLW